MFSLGIHRYRHDFICIAERYLRNKDFGGGGFVRSYTAFSVLRRPRQKLYIISMHVLEHLSGNTLTQISRGISRPLKELSVELPRHREEVVFVVARTNLLRWRRLVEEEAKVFAVSLKGDLWGIYRCSC